MRVILGLDAPTAGRATVSGQPYQRLPARCARSGRCSTPAPCTAAAPPAITCGPSRPATESARRRVAEVLGLVGPGQRGRRRVGGFSLGMRQRLGIAAALLGDPPVLLFDEPVNGLDPEGIRWIRGLLKSLAAEGRTVFVSSHLMSEMALTAEHLIVIGRGRLVADTPIDEFVRQSSRDDVLVRSPAAAMPWPAC